MELKDYTTEELKAELKRRRAEAFKSLDRKPEYIYGTGIVTYSTKDAFLQRRYDVKLSDESMAEYNLDSTRRTLWSISCDKKKIKSADSPKTGDTVIIRYRLTRKFRQPFLWRDKAIISEVIKRAD